MIAYADEVNVNTFKSNQTVDDVLNIILDAEQEGKPDLQRLFNSIDNSQVSSSPTPIHTIIFVSKLDQTTVKVVKPIADRLKTKNFDLTLVALGANLDLGLFNQLTPNVIPWDLAKKKTPDNWEEQFKKAFGCSKLQLI